MDKKRVGFRPLILFLISMLLTAVAIFSLSNLQRENAVAFAEIAVERWTKLLRSKIYNDLDYIGSAANFFHSTEPEDWSHFPDFAEGLTSQTLSLVAVQWMQKVESRDINTHLQFIHQTFPDATLYTTITNNGIDFGYDKQVGEPRYIATDVYPRTSGNLQVLGFYSTKERFKKILQSTKQSGKPSLSDKVTLLQDDIYSHKKADGFLVYYPVFEKQGTELKGIVIGVLRASVYFNTLISDSMNEPDVAIKIVDTGFDSSDAPILYQSPHWEDSYSLELSDTLYFPNRAWSLHYRFQKSMIESDKASLLFIGLLGLIISFLLSRMVYKEEKQKELLEQELESRTKELNYLVNHDPQTNTLNRRAFNELFATWISQREPFGLLTFDVDNFKIINDRYGHPTGDAALRHIAEKVTAALYDNDKLFRVGGDEFYVLSRLNAVDELANHAESMRTMVANYPLIAEHDVSLSISIGGAIWHGEDMERFAHNVDLELYKSKEKGKNCVSISSGNWECLPSARTTLNR